MTDERFWIIVDNYDNGILKPADVVDMIYEANDEDLVETMEDLRMIIIDRKEYTIARKYLETLVINKK